MSDRLKALREKRGTAYKAMTDITEAAQKEKRDLTKEELDKHGALFDEIEGHRRQIEAEERTVELARQAASEELREQDERRERERGKGSEEGEAEKRSMDAFRGFLRSGKIDPEQRAALNAGTDPEGGYLVAPTTFVAGLLKNVDDNVFIKAASNNIQLGTAKSLGVITLDTDPDDFEWTTELATGSEDAAMRFGKREFVPNPLAKRIKISKKLLRNSVTPVDQTVRSRLAYKLGITLEKNYLLGNGAKKPLGVFVASNDGIPTSRDVSEGSTTTALTFDSLIAAKYSLKAAYWGAAKWMFHRDAVKKISLLKDLEGQYMWRPSVREGEPDTILGHGLMVSEYVPNTFTTGLYVGMFADFSNYWTCDALDMQVQVLTELYAETNQDGFILRYEGDGAPALPEAFARLKLA